MCKKEQMRILKLKFYKSEKFHKVTLHLTDLSLTFVNSTRPKSDCLKQYNNLINSNVSKCSHTIE